ncbi:MAG TPA: tRNA (adenosine(37)-N6)-dimethylallyltransferase MiaA [Bacteroidia bacterium]|nr:tRNA (adenosine(37)-N6)-dimethylallyltransferase MiaA [Bacteroidia bacterium]
MQHLISIVGPTGVGKTAYALHLAQRLQCPIISADSVQIYKGLDIGSGKATAAERALATHFMIDILPPDAAFNAGEFARRFDALANELFLDYRHLIVVGGTGLYFQGIWEGFDDMPEVPEEIRLDLNAELAREGGLAKLQAELSAVDPGTWAVIDRQNPARIIRALEVWRTTGRPISEFRKGEKKRQNPWEEIRIGLELPREVLYKKIEQRVDMMLAEGLLEETRRIGLEFGLDCKGLESLGYREMVGFLRGEYEWAQAVELMKRNTRRYAKRQFTWFRRYPEIRWFAPDAFEELDAYMGGALP